MLCLANKPTSKAAKPKGATKKPFGDVSFITYDLPKDDKTACKAWLTTLDDFDNTLLRFEQEGFKVSSKWDTRNDCYAAFVTPDETNTGLKGFILTGRGSTPCKAIKNAMYQHYFVFQQNWADWYEHNEREEIDD